MKYGIFIVIPQSCPTLEIKTAKDTLSSSTAWTFFSAVTTPTLPKRLVTALKPASDATEVSTRSALNFKPLSGVSFVRYGSISPYFDTSTEKDDNLHFKQSEYNISAVAKQIGILYQFSAVTSHIDEVVFGIDTDDGET